MYTMYSNLLYVLITVSLYHNARNVPTAAAAATPTRKPITPKPVYPSLPPTNNLYCFPSTADRQRYLNMWNNFTMEVKERAEACGPASNYFSRQSVSVNVNELSLMFKKVSTNWSAGEVRLILNSAQPFTYGTFRFHVKTVQVRDSANSNSVISNILPPNLVLGLFTWDIMDNYDVQENYSHEVDVEVSQWGDPTNKDVQFLVQPPGTPQQVRFFSGPQGTSWLNQSNHTFQFQWLPGAIYWSTTAGGGVTFNYTTEYAITHSKEDLVQCLPAHVEIRINLWNIDGNAAPTGLSSTQYVQVTLDQVSFEPSNQTFVPVGGYCSKHCQCEAYSGCQNGRCKSTQTSSPISKPSRKPSRKPSFRPSKSPVAKPTRKPSIQKPRKPTKRPAAKPTRKPTKTPVAKPTRKPTKRPSKRPTKSPL